MQAMNSRILLVDDEKDISDLIEEALLKTALQIFKKQTQDWTQFRYAENISRT